MAKPPARTIPAERLALYERLVDTLPGVERKGATVPYTSVNGHMFSFLTPTGGLALRLPAADREAFLERYATTLHEAHGFQVSPPKGGFLMRSQVPSKIQDRLQAVP